MTRRTRCGLTVGIIGLALGACATLSPEQRHRNDVLLGAAEECRRSFSTIRPERIDSFGRLAFSYYDLSERQPFVDCYRRVAAARLQTDPSTIGAQDGTPMMGSTAK